MKITTLVYLECEGQILMLYRNKKKNDPNAGKWLGVGGKLEEGETLDECAAREVFEETGIKEANLSRIGLIHFISDVCEDEDMYLYKGVLTELPILRETNEGELKWIDKDKLWGLPMWEGDRVFLEDLLRGCEDIYYTLRYEGDKLVSKEKKG